MKLSDLRTVESREKTDVRPNRTAAFVYIVLLVIDLGVLLFNELDIFHVDKLTMRVSMIVNFVIGLIPVIFGLNKKWAALPWVKYVTFVSLTVLCFFDYMLLGEHAFLMIVTPLFLATQYRSKKIMVIAIIGGFFCSLFSPIFGYLGGFWAQDGFFTFLAQTFGRMTITSTPVESDTGYDILQVLLFYQLPALAFLVVFSIIVNNVVNNNIRGLETETALESASRTDRLTGLLNQNLYQEFVEHNDEAGNLGIIFLDINGLKKANDAKGHEYGDLLIERCADSVKKIIDENTYGFRIGGDEFIVIFQCDSKERAEEKLKQWENALFQVNLENRQKHPGLVCSMAWGMTFGEAKQLSSLIHDADNHMYNQKRRV